MLTGKERVAPEPALSLSKGLALFETGDFNFVSTVGFLSRDAEPSSFFPHNHPRSKSIDLRPVVRNDNNRDLVGEFRG